MKKGDGGNQRNRYDQISENNTPFKSQKSSGPNNNGTQQKSHEGTKNERSF